jgi:hypothetical protein
MGRRPISSQPFGSGPVGRFSVRRLPDLTRMTQIWATRIWALYRQSGSDRLEKQRTVGVHTYEPIDKPGVFHTEWLE